MKRMKRMKVVKNILNVVLLAMLLGACAQKDTPHKGEATTTTSSSTTPPIQAVGVVIGSSDVLFDRDSGTILAYTGGSDEIIIPSTIDGVDVLAIGERAFSNHNITRVQLPDSLVVIESYAFDSNLLAGALVIPASVERIEQYAFYGTLRGIFNHIDSLVFEPGSKLNYIGQEAFGHNTLTKLQLPEGIITIGINAFANNLLTSFNIPNSVEVLEMGAFNRNAMVGEEAFIYHHTRNGVDKTVLYGFAGPVQSSDITIPEQVEEIMEGAFSHSFLTGTLTISKNVRVIGYGAFMQNYFDQIVIPEDSKLEVLHKYALNGVHADMILLPKGLKQIGEGALSGDFKTIINLTSMTVNDFVQKKVISPGLCELKVVGDGHQTSGKLELCDRTIEIVSQP